MMWLADVLIGTTSQQWDRRYGPADAADSGPKAPRAGRFSAAVTRVWTSLKAWNERRRVTHYLNQLNDHLLRDVGITRDQIPEFVRNGGLVQSTDTTRPTNESPPPGQCYLVASGKPSDQHCGGAFGDSDCRTDVLKRAA